MRCNETLRCWLLALALSWTNLANGWVWISFASISDFTAQYYEVSLGQVNWVSLLYAVIMTAGAIPIIWLIDKFGIKSTLVLASVLNLFCSLLHVLSSWTLLTPTYRYPILILGSVLGGLAQPIGLFSTTKMAATWFVPESRVSANTLASMGNPLGILLSNLVSPSLVTDHTDLPLLNLVNLGPPFLGLLFVLLAVILAPARLNVSLVRESISFFDQSKSCLGNVQFCVLAICFGIGLATFTAISTLIQQILCPVGYSDLFSGICGALFLGLGFPGVVLVGLVVRKSGHLREVVKWCILLTSVGMVALSVTSTLPGQHLLVAGSVSWMGLFGFGAYPSSLELAAEVAYPAGEVISSGVLISISQVLGLIVIPVAQELAVPSPHLSSIARCSVDDIRSYWIPTTGLAVLGVLNASVFMLKFNSNTHQKKVGLGKEATKNGNELSEPLLPDP